MKESETEGQILNFDLNIKVNESGVFWDGKELSRERTKGNLKIIFPI
jgi:hypothetical protein